MESCETSLSSGRRLRRPPYLHPFPHRCHTPFSSSHRFLHTEFSHHLHSLCCSHCNTKSCYRVHSSRCACHVGEYCCRSLLLSLCCLIPHSPSAHSQGACCGFAAAGGSDHQQRLRQLHRIDSGSSTNGRNEETRAYWRTLHYTSLLSLIILIPITLVSGELQHIHPASVPALSSPRRFCRPRRQAR
ncbi:hypothetical protein BJ546DRAFT_125365 [Cryomyces antarcticus]